MKMKIVPLLVLIIAGCVRHSYDEALTRAIDSLIKEVALLRQELQKSDSDNLKNHDTMLMREPTSTVRPVIQKRDSVKQKLIKVKQRRKEGATNDTVFFKFSDGRISVKVYPWQDGKQLIEVFSLQGGVVYTFENVWLSYQISNTLHFRPDGSLGKVNSHMNPGASMYWYESVTQFESDNQPSWMITYRFPQISVLDAMGEKYYWDRGEKRWVKQKYIEETSTPGQ